MVEEKESYYEKNVGGVHENIPSTSFAHKPSTPPHMPSSSISNVESVHVEAPNMSNVDASKLANVEAQAMAWKLHNCLTTVVNKKIASQKDHNLDKSHHFLMLL
jgi:hypothetical protein